MALLALAVGAALRLSERMVTKAQQRCLVAIGDQPDVATVASVASVGTTTIDMSLSPHRDGSGAAVPGLGMELCLINELRHLSILGGSPRLAGAVELDPQ